MKKKKMKQLVRTVKYFTELTHAKKYRKIGRLIVYQNDTSFVIRNPGVCETSFTPCKGGRFRVQILRYEGYTIVQDCKLGAKYARKLARWYIAKKA
jgi:hypothetical protein